MKDSFTSVDIDNSRTLDVNELLNALTKAGYRITQHALVAALPKFDIERKGSLTFDQYLDLCIYLGNMNKLFKFYDPQNTGRILVNFDQIIASTPYFN